MVGKSLHKIFLWLDEYRAGGRTMLRLFPDSWCFGLYKLWGPVLSVTSHIIIFKQASCYFTQKAQGLVTTVSCSLKLSHLSSSTWIHLSHTWSSWPLFFYFFVPKVGQKCTVNVTSRILSPHIRHTLNDLQQRVRRDACLNSYLNLKTVNHFWHQWLQLSELFHPRQHALPNVSTEDHSQLYCYLVKMATEKGSTRQMECAVKRYKYWPV